MNLRCTCTAYLHPPSNSTLLESRGSRSQGPGQAISLPSSRTRPAYSSTAHAHMQYSPPFAATSRAPAGSAPFRLNFSPVQQISFPHLTSFALSTNNCQPYHGSERWIRIHTTDALGITTDRDRMLEKPLSVQGNMSLFSHSGLLQGTNGCIEASVLYPAPFNGRGRLRPSSRWDR